VIAAGGGAGRRSAKTAAAPVPEGQPTELMLALLLEVVADYTRFSAVQGAGHAGH
jgi:hypothetical protein